MKTIFQVTIGLFLLFTAISLRGQVTPPQPPTPGPETPPDALYDSDPNPVIGTVTFTPNPMTDIVSANQNHIVVVATDDGVITQVYLKFGKTSIEEQTIALTNSSLSNWEADLPALDVGNYVYVITATDNSMQLSTSAENYFAITEGIPPTPSNLLVTTVKQDRLILKWDAAEKATSYWLEVSKSSDYASPVFSADIGNVLEKELTGLDAATPYYFRVKSIRVIASGSLESPYQTGDVTTLSPLADEPTDYPSSFRSGSDSEISRFNLYWTSATTGILPDGYLIRIVKNNTHVVFPVDGIVESEDVEGVDGTLTKLVNSGSQTTITLPGFETIWQASIFPYKGSNEAINYKTDGAVPSVQLITPLQSGVNGWINEIHYDNSGTDSDEMIEIVIEKSSNYLLTDFQIILYNGSDGKSYSTKSLPSVPGSTSNGFDLFSVAAPGIQNGPDGVVLSYQNKVIQFLSYGGSFSATNGIASGMTSENLPTQETTSTTIGYSLQLSGQGSCYNDFLWNVPQLATAGALNLNQTLDASSPSTVWLGAVSSEWDNPANWSSGIPDNTLKAIIPAGKLFSPQISATGYCKSLVLESDASLLGQDYLPDNCLVYSQRKMSAGKWLFLTPPVNGVTSGIFKPLTGLVYMIDYNNSQPVDQSSWEYIADTTKLFIPGTGYGFFGTREEPTLTFSGLPIKTSLIKPLYFSPNGNNWNFVGNPFLGALNWTQLEKQTTTGTAYLFDPNQKSYIAIASDGVTSVVDFTDQFAPMQGFFIESISAGSLLFDIGKVVSSEQYFLKEIATNEPIVRIRAIGPNGSDAVAIQFCPSANDHFIITEDSKKLFYHEPGVPQLAFVTDNQRVAISRCQTLVGSFPVMISLTDNAQVELSAQLEGVIPDNISVMLVDKVLDKSIDIRQNQSLRVALPAGEQLNRFALELTEVEIPPVVPIDEFRIYSVNDEIRLESPKIIDGYISIYNLAGQKIIERAINGTSATFLTGKGHFILRLRDKAGIKTEKMIVP